MTMMWVEESLSRYKRCLRSLNYISKIFGVNARGKMPALLGLKMKTKSQRSSMRHRLPNTNKMVRITAALSVKL